MIDIMKEHKLFIKALTGELGIGWRYSTRYTGWLLSYLGDPIITLYFEDGDKIYIGWGNDVHKFYLSDPASIDQIISLCRTTKHRLQFGGIS